jgi:PST family polysaccharide transporter
MIKKRVLISVVWAVIGQFGSQTIRYLVLLALAHVLSPSDFGLLGMAMIFILFTQAIGELGIAAAVVQQQTSDDLYLHTAFWSNLVLSLVMYWVTLLFATPIASFLGDAAVTPLIQVLAIIFPITALSVVPRAILEKDFKFRKLTHRELLSELAFGVVGLSFAVLGQGTWSLVAAAIAQRVASIATMWWAVPWRPRLQFNLPILRTMLRFALPVMWSNLLNKGLANIDYFVIGRWLGSEALGYYTLAFQLAVVPLQRMVGILRRVAFPAFSQIQQDLRRLQTGFTIATKYLFLFLLPISVMILLFAPEFIELFYADKWETSILLIQILAIAGLFYGFDIVEPLYFALGRPQMRVWIIGFRLLLFALLCVFLLPLLGLTGVALSLTISVAISSVIGFRLGMGAIDAPFLQTLSPVAGMAIAIAVATFVVTLLTELPYVHQWPPTIAGLTIKAILLVSLYGACIAIILPDLRKRILTTITISGGWGRLVKYELDRKNK